MYEKRVQYALDNFIAEKYFLDMNSEYHLKEEKDSGKSDLLVHINTPNLCIHDFDNKKKCNFLKEGPEAKRTGMQKSVDHMIFERKSTGWTLHMIEMKKGVGYRTWENIKLKMRTSYLTACAIGQFLGIEFHEVLTYTTYEEDRFERLSETTNPKVFVPKLGESAIDLKKEEWDNNQICMTIGEKVTFPHQRIKMIMNHENNTLEGSIEL